MKKEVKTINTKRLLGVLMTHVLLLGFATPVYAGAPDTDVEASGTLKPRTSKEEDTDWIKVNGMKVTIDMDTRTDGLLVTGAEVEIDVSQHRQWSPLL